MDNILAKITRVLDANYQNTDVEDKFMQAIFNEVVDLYGIREYVDNGLVMGCEAPMLFASAGYDKDKRQIKFFDTTLRDAKYEVAVYIKKLPESKRVFASNLLLVTTLLHELEHVRQEYIKENDDSFEAELLRMEDGKTETMSSYNLMPSERFAESRALSYALAIMSKSETFAPDLEDYLEMKRNLCLIRGYEDTYNQCQTYPIKRYMECHNIKYVPMSVTEALEIEPRLENRLFYGLPITEEEYRATRTKAGLKNGSKGYAL